jgi:hypothetical protein
MGGGRMSAVTVPAQRGRRSSRRPRPVAWTRLTWITWRQHRTALAGAGAVLAVAALYLWIMGIKIHDAYAAYAACHPASSSACAQLGRVFTSYYGSQAGPAVTAGINAQSVPYLLLAIPVLVGAFVGGPVLAREFEAGTFRFAWTQGTGRLRWTIARLVPLAVAVTAAAEGLSQLFTWYLSPFVEDGDSGRFPIQVFGDEGVAFAAWTLLSFALAAFLGALFRRAIVAITAALAVGTTLDMVTMLDLRSHYAAPLTTTGSGPGNNAGDWVLSGWFTTSSGQRLSERSIMFQAGHVGPGGRVDTTYSELQQFLTSHHYLQWFSYQPASRFWSFQLIEGGWLLALSLILLAGTVWLVRAKAAG